MLSEIYNQIGGLNLVAAVVLIIAAIVMFAPKILKK